MTTRRRDMAADLEREILEELKDDYVGAWDVAWLVSDDLGTEDPTEVRECALGLLERMLLFGEIRAGAATDEGEFEPWPEPPGEALHKIRERWERLERTPTLGEVAWFDLTPFGERLAAQS
jgi:hypothetical protein